MFRLENVSYHDILTSINLEFAEGKVSCITGESGAGKSTILKFLNKMLIPTKGKVYYRDKLLRDIDSIDLRRKAVMLSQEPVIFDGNIEENLQIGLKFSRKDFAPKNTLKDALRIVSLDKSLDEKAERLSGGEKQRLALARVFLMQPEVYLLDEPTSALDQRTEMEVMEKYLQALKEHAATVIMVTHSQSVAETFAEESFVITQKSKSG